MSETSLAGLPARGLARGSACLCAAALLLRCGAPSPLTFLATAGALGPRGPARPAPEPRAGAGPAPAAAAWGPEGGSALAASALAAGGAAAGRRRRQLRPRQRAVGAAGGAEGEAAAAGAGEEKKVKPARVIEDAVEESEKGPFEKYKWSNLSEETQEDLKTFFSSLAVALTIRGFLVEPRFIPSLSMYPNFEVGDQLTVDKISKRWRPYERRDVVVFNPPPAFFEVVGGDRQGEALIKRIVALEGDVVEMKSGGFLYINGEKQEEPFTNEKAKYDFPPVKVPEGCVFVLGDNRNASLDGHVWGFLPKENIIGRATLKFWPPWRVGGIEASPP